MKLFFSINNRDVAKSKKPKVLDIIPLLLISCLLSGCTGLPDHSNSTLSTDNKSAGKLKTKSNNQQEPSRFKHHITHNDLWESVRAKMSSEVDQNNPRIDYYVRWFSKHPGYFEKLMERSRPYLYYIMKEVEKRNIPSEFALVPAVESAFDPFAYSNGLAAGLWQITPSTGKYYEVKQDWWFDGRRDVVTATEFALNYFQELYKEFNNWKLALAAYNAGNGTVGRAIKKNLKLGKPISYWNLPLPRQTENYVPKLLAVAKIVKNPSLYNIKLDPIPDKPYFKKVDTGSQIDLKRAASMANISFKDLRQLNPGFNRWATDPNGPFTLLLPVKHAKIFKTTLASMPSSERISWQRYTVHSGDTLNSIAKIFNASPDIIKAINRLQSTTIYSGETLLIPQPIDDNTIITHKQKALALAQAKNILSDNQGRIRHQYTVKSGDSLWKIAKEHNLSITELTKWNHFTKTNTVHPGQTLLLWIGRENLIRKNYIVKSGDNLWNIAKRFGTTIDQVLEWNKLSPRALLHPKQKLVIWKPPSDVKIKTQLTHSGSVIRKVFYTVKQGESIKKIANKFRVQSNQITYWNTLKTHHIKPGQQLTLFVDVTHTN